MSTKPFFLHFSNFSNYSNFLNFSNVLYLPKHLTKGEYLWDFRAWNLSINGQTLRDWFFEDYVFNADGGGSPLVTGFYYDDSWSMNGPSECLGNLSIADMGLSKQDLAEITAAYQSARADLFAETIKRGLFSWQMFTGVSSPSTNAKTCATTFRTQCTPNAYVNNTVYVQLPANNSDPNAVDTAVATFLLIRRDYAFIGHGW